MNGGWTIQCQKKRKNILLLENSNECQQILYTYSPFDRDETHCALLNGNCVERF